MHTGYIVVSVLLAALLIHAAGRKLSHRPDVVASYARVGVPEHRLKVLAMLLLAGAIGVVAGIFVAPIGIAAALCLAVYFALAIAAHMRHGDLANVATPVVMLALSVVVLVLRL
jgi:hypothetical protein